MNSNLLSILFILLNSFQRYLPLIIAVGLFALPTVTLLMIVVIKMVIKHFKRVKKDKTKDTSSEIKAKFLAPFGENNIISTSVEMTRVTVEVSDISKVSIDGLRELGVGVLISGNVIKCSSSEFAKVMNEEK